MTVDFVRQTVPEPSGVAHVEAEVAVAVGFVDPACGDRS